MSAWANYDDVLRQLRDFGLEVQDLQVDTPRPVRCRTRTDRGREKTGWYILHELRTAAGGSEERIHALLVEHVELLLQDLARQLEQAVSRVTEDAA